MKKFIFFLLAVMFSNSILFADDSISSRPVKKLKLYVFHALSNDTVINISLNPEDSVARPKFVNKKYCSLGECLNDAKLSTSDSLYWVRTFIDGIWRKEEENWVYNSDQGYKIILEAKQEN